jgi:hypothetical protein
MNARPQPRPTHPIRPGRRWGRSVSRGYSSGSFVAAPFRGYVQRNEIADLDKASDAGYPEK